MLSVRNPKPIRDDGFNRREACAQKRNVRSTLKTLFRSLPVEFHFPDSPENAWKHS